MVPRRIQGAVAIITLEGEARPARSVDESIWLGAMLLASLGLGSLGISALRSAGWHGGMAIAAAAVTCWAALAWYYRRRFMPYAQAMRYEAPAAFEAYGRLLHAVLLPPYALAFLAAITMPRGRGSAGAVVLSLYIALIPLLLALMLWRWSRSPRQAPFQSLFRFGIGLGAAVATLGLIAMLQL